METQNKIKIAIAGIGGIGGYIGGKLAHYYNNSDDVHISFICRGEHLKAIKENGLELISNNQTLICHPHLVSNNPSEIGKLEVLIICTKNFALKELLVSYAECITHHTVIITTQNTISGNETITPLLTKETTLLEGVIYIASNMNSPGKINHVSGPSKLIFGTNGLDEVKGKFIAEILNKAGIDATFTTNINSILWKKFMFVSPAAIVTAIYNITIPAIVQNYEPHTLYTALISDLMLLAKAKEIEIDKDTIANNCKLLENFAPTVKSSFQLDLEKNKRTEINSLVHYVIAESKKHGLQANSYKSALNELSEKYELYY
jgi:2-dehydropantoate 2-reductase